MIDVFVERITFEHDAVGVHYVVTVAPLEENIQTQTFPGKVDCETSRMDRFASADYDHVLCVDHAVAVLVDILYISGHDLVTFIAVGRHTFFKRETAVGIEREILVAVYAVPFVSVELCHRIADTGDVEVGVVIVVGEADLREQELLAFGKRHDAAAVEADVEIGGPGEVTGLDVHGTERQFDTVIADSSDIFEYGGVSRTVREIGVQPAGLSYFCGRCRR